MMRELSRMGWLDWLTDRHILVLSGPPGEDTSQSPAVPCPYLHLLLYIVRQTDMCVRCH